MPACPTCGASSPADARFCIACGSRLADDVPPERRKLATVLFCDLTGSTALGERLDAESVRSLSLRYFEAMRAVVERHGGSVEKFIGDAVVALFGVPVAHEDDALRAIRAALEMQERMAALSAELEPVLGSPLQIHVGIDTGEVVTGPASGAEPRASGDVMNVAARLEEAAAPGEILIGERTRLLARDHVAVEPVGPLALKGKSGRVPAYRVRTLLAVPPDGRRLRARLVGRQGDLLVLEASLADCRATRRARVVAVTGEPGAGKSRIVREFLDASAGGALVLRGRCPSYGEGITYWPLAQALRAAAGIQADDPAERARTRLDRLVARETGDAATAELLAAAAGLSAAPASPDDIAWAARELLVALAREEPVVLVLDDLQWAEPTFLRLVDALATAPAPLLLLCLARSEIAERPDWTGSSGERAVVALGPLADGDAASLVDDALGRGLDRRLRARLIETAGGNPLFLEELCEMLIDTGLVRRVEGGWVPSGEMPEIPLPLTLDALLASRVDLLGADERAVIECAAVEGRAFTRDAVLTLSPPAAREGVDGALQALVERDLVRATSADGLPGYRFHHQLIRDVVYRSIPKAQRARSHEQLATWLERDAPTRAAELAEIAGYHLEQAWACRRELGAPPEQSRGLASRGAARLETAASRALTRGDVFAAIKLLRRAVALLADDEPRRARLLADLGAALTEAGALSEAREALDGARAAARRLGDDALAARTHVEELILELQVDPERSIAAAPPVIRDAAAAFERAGDDLGSCRLAYLEALVHWFQGRAAAAEAAWERAAGHARRLGDAHRLSDIVRWIPSAALWGPSPAEEGIRRCELLLLEQLGRSRQARAEAQGALAGLYAMTGRFERAAELVQESDAIFDEVGFTLHATPEWSAFVAMLAGDAASAEARLRAGYVRLEQMGERAFLSTTAALLARALLALGDEREALAFTETSERTAAPADLVTQIAWRGTRARILAARGETAAAERLAREAVELAARTDLLCDHGDALLDLAAVLRAEDRPQDAAGAARQALELYERKGNLVSADRARSLLHEIAPP